MRHTPNRISSRTHSPYVYVQAIREGELATKRTPASGGRRRRDKRNVQKGTVAALKPRRVLTVAGEHHGVGGWQAMCGEEDGVRCVLVVDDEEEGLSGIFTAEDVDDRVRASPPIVLNTRVLIARDRFAAEGLDAHTRVCHGA